MQFKLKSSLSPWRNLHYMPARKGNYVQYMYKSSLDYNTTAHFRIVQWKLPCLKREEQNHLKSQGNPLEGLVSYIPWSKNNNTLKKKNPHTSRNSVKLYSSNLNMEISDSPVSCQLEKIMSCRKLWSSDEIVLWKAVWKGNFLNVSFIYFHTKTQVSRQKSTRFEYFDHIFSSQRSNWEIEGYQSIFLIKSLEIGLSKGTVSSPYSFSSMKLI